MLIILGDMTFSLHAVIDVFSEFCQYLALTINLAKSSLMLLDGDAAQPVSQSCLIPIASTFKKLKFHVTPTLTGFCHLKIIPLFAWFRYKINIWNKLKLSVASRTNVIIMIIMPQLLFFLLKSPTVASLAFFRVVNLDLSHITMQ